MTNLMLNLFLISLVVIYIVDLSGFVDEMIKRLHHKYVKVGDYHNLIPKFKPFSCSLCSVFWAGIIYLIATHTFSIPMLAYVCLLSFMADTIGDAIIFVKEAFITFINILYTFIKPKTY